MSSFYIIGTRPWLNWIECVATDHEVGGSSPPGRTYKANPICPSPRGRWKFIPNIFRERV